MSAILRAISRWDPAVQPGFEIAMLDGCAEASTGEREHVDQPTGPAWHDLRRDDRTALVHRQLDRRGRPARSSRRGRRPTRRVRGCCCARAGAQPSRTRGRTSPDQASIGLAERPDQGERAAITRPLRPLAPVDRRGPAEAVAVRSERPNATTSHSGPWLCISRRERRRHVCEAERTSSMVTPTVFGTFSIEGLVAPNVTDAGPSIDRLAVTSSWLPNSPTQNPRTIKWLRL